MKWHQTKTADLILQNNMDAWRQRLNVEKNNQQKGMQEQIDKLQAELDSKNSYFMLSKTEGARMKMTEDAAHRAQNEFGFDKVFAHYDEKTAGSVKYEDRTVGKKAKINNGIVREEHQAITTSSQQVGWREPYDNLNGLVNRTGICKRTFHDPSHL